MNKQRRTSLAEISQRISDLTSEAETLRDALRDLCEEEQDYFDNMPEGLQGGERGESSQEAINQLEDAITTLDDMVSADIGGMVDNAIAN